MANPPTGKNNGMFVTNDIGFSVLSKLPLKSMKRFSSACKSWSQEFEKPSFLQKFFNNLVSKSHDNDDVKPLFNINDRLYLRSGDNFQDEKELDMNLPSPFDARHFHILGSAIQGVLCLYIVDNQKNIILWNPDVSGQYRVLPTDYAEDLGSPDEDFVPNFQVHGFGYDTANHDFKVIQLVNYYGYDDDETISFWQVYCLRTNKWTKLNIPTGNQIPFLQYNPNGLEVYLDGFCHWLGRVEAYGQLYLVSFNLTNYKLSVAAAPVDVEVTERSLKLVVLNGSVAMITQHADPMSFSISILGQIGVKESWTTFFNVASSPSIKNPIAAGKKGVIFFKGNEKDGKVACFDLSTGMIEKEIDFGAKNNIQQIIFYKESGQILSKKRKNTRHH